MLELMRREARERDSRDDQQGKTIWRDSKEDLAHSSEAIVNEWRDHACSCLNYELR